jgi:hypothetical protein
MTPGGAFPSLPSPSSPAIPVSLFSGRPPRATACPETGSDLGKSVLKTCVFIGVH